jgi:hypothetical protein
MGAVGGILLRQLENERLTLRDELTKLRTAAPTVVASSVPSQPPLVKQPALWFAVAGWAVAIVLLFRRKTI